MTEVESFYLYHIQEEKLIPLEDGMVFGRGRDNHYPVSDDLVSGKHIKVNIRDGNAFLTDLRSANQTLINGHTLSPLRKYLLNEEDKVRIGDQKFIFTRDAHASFVAEASITINLSLGGNTAPNLQVDEEGEAVSTKAPAPSVAPIKSHSDYLGQLKHNRQTLKALEDSLVDVEEKMARLDTLKEEIVGEQEVLEVNSKKLEGTHIDSEEKFVQEINGFDDGIQKAEDKINEAKKTIERLQKEIVMLLEKSEETKEFHEFFQARETAKSNYENMKNEIEELETADLKSKRSGIVRDIRKENKRYKEIQELYGDSLAKTTGAKNKKIQKLSLDKKMLLDKK